MKSSFTSAGKSKWLRGRFDGDPYQSQKKQRTMYGFVVPDLLNRNEFSALHALWWYLFFKGLPPARKSSRTKIGRMVILKIAESASFSNDEIEASSLMFRVQNKDDRIISALAKWPERGFRDDLFAIFSAEKGKEKCLLSRKDRLESQVSSLTHTTGVACILPVGHIFSVVQEDFFRFQSSTTDRKEHHVKI